MTEERTITLADAVAGWLALGPDAVLTMLGQAMQNDAGRRTANKRPEWADVPKASLNTIGELLQKLGYRLALGAHLQASMPETVTITAAATPTGTVTWTCAGCGSAQEISGVQRCPGCANAGVPPTAAMLLDAPSEPATVAVPDFSTLLADPAPDDDDDDISTMMPQGEQAQADIGDPGPKA